MPIVDPNAGGSGGGIPNDIGQGFASYNDTSTINDPVDLLPATWTDMPNNGAGPYGSINFVPTGTTSLIDTLTGYLDFTELQNGDTVFVRTHYEVTPEANHSEVQFRISAGAGFGVYNLPESQPLLDSGAGVRYPRVKLHKICIFDDNTRLNPVKLQVKCSVNAVFKNFGSTIMVTRK